MRAAALLRSGLPGALLCSLVACKGPPKADADAAPTVASATTPPPPGVGGPLVNGMAPSDYGPTLTPEHPHIPPPIETNHPIATTSTELVPGAKPKPVDPFAAPIAAVEASSVGCFAGQPPGEYTAVISVKVTPAGTATRIDIEGTTDAGIVSCLTKAATRTWPSSKDGRSLRIPVTVKG